MTAGHLVQTRGNHFGLPDRMNLVVGRVADAPAGLRLRHARRAGRRRAAGTSSSPAATSIRRCTATASSRRIERTREDRAEGRIVRILERGSSDHCRPLRRRRRRHGLPRAVRPATDHGRPDPARTSGRTRSPATWSSSRSPVGRRRRAARSAASLEVLGDIDEPGVDTEIIIRKYGITDEHSDEAIEEATRLGSAVKEKDIKGRTDFRPIATVTIDGEHARDFDDAITIEKLPQRQLLARRPHRRRRALRARRRRARRGSLRARRRRSTFPSAPCTCSRPSSRPACAASTRTSIAWCSPA